MPTSAVVGTSGEVGARLRRAKRNRAQGAGLDMRQQHRQIEERHLHLLAEQVVDGGRRAPVGHVHDVDPGRQLEQFTGKMRQAADAGGCEIEFPRLGLGERDQLLHVAGGQRCWRQQAFPAPSSPA